MARRINPAAGNMDTGKEAITNRISKGIMGMEKGITTIQIVKGIIEIIGIQEESIGRPEMIGTGRAGMETGVFGGIGMTGSGKVSIDGIIKEIGEVCTITAEEISEGMTEDFTGAMKDGLSAMKIAQEILGITSGKISENMTGDICVITTGTVSILTKGGIWKKGSRKKILGIPESNVMAASINTNFKSNLTTGEINLKSSINIKNSNSATKEGILSKISINTRINLAIKEDISSKISISIKNRAYGVPQKGPILSSRGSY
ncbi:MAG TPA: hypothetical protein DIT25_01275 [Candidatus Moranbacteria bacterium]|nr:hypothetical protein [Candidatus Moranbacteria bacterium]